MDFPTPLRSGRLRRRYKRFLADIVLDDGEEITAHCPNPGAMLGLDSPGFPVWVSKSDNPKRKLAHTLELVAPSDGVMVGVHTGHPNRLAAEALDAGLIPALSGYDAMRREVKYGRNSRIDILLESEGAPLTYVEVKNVHLLREPGLAEFPDCVTARGAKHLVELGDMVAAGHRAAMVFLVQRDDADRFRLADDLDPAYAAAFQAAVERGVEAHVVGCTVTPTRIVADRLLTFA